MIDICSDTDFIYPLKADIFYPIVKQGAYGEVNKEWVLDRSISCNFEPTGTSWAEEVKPNPKINIEIMLMGRTKEDIRVTSSDSEQAIVNVVLTNIRTRSGNQIYTETSGTRKGRPTIFEIASNEPIVGPFGDIEYYKLIIRRSENQATDL